MYELSVFTPAIQIDILLRLLLAGVCGAIVGFERKSRLKEAGIRTHFIVSMAASLLMVISKYGFYDVLREGFVSVDPSRVASTIVSGVGFLGAGMIFVRKNTINGLTTAAGIWATAGIGMAIGAGMYITGIATTVIVLLVQILLHKNLRFLHVPQQEHMRIIISNESEAINELKQVFDENHIEVMNIKIEKSENLGYLTVDMVIKLPSNFDLQSFMFLFRENNKIKSVEL